MKWIKFGGVVIAAILVVVVIVRVNSCMDTLQGVETNRTVTPADSNFNQIEHQVYRPPSLPFSKNTSGVKLPQGVREKDVARVTRLKWRGFEHPTDVIELKTGEVLVEKDAELEDVTILEFAAPIMQLGLFPAAGISFPSSSRSRTGVVSPVGSLALVEWYGVVRLPSLSVDLDGIGVGAQVKLYHELYAGPLVLWRYEDTKETMVKITLQYNF